MQANTKKVIDTLVGLIANAAHTDDALAASAAIENVLALDAKESATVTTNAPAPVLFGHTPLPAANGIQGTGA